MFSHKKRATSDPFYKFIYYVSNIDVASATTVPLISCELSPGDAAELIY